MSPTLPDKGPKDQGWRGFIRDLFADTLRHVPTPAVLHGYEKSDPAIVAVKPANKAKEAYCGDICGGGRSGVGGAGGQGEYAPAKHVLGSEPGSRDKGAGACTATLP